MNETVIPVAASPEVIVTNTSRRCENLLQLNREPQAIVNHGTVRSLRFAQICNLIAALIVGRGATLDTDDRADG